VLFTAISGNQISKLTVHSVSKKIIILLVKTIGSILGLVRLFHLSSRLEGDWGGINPLQVRCGFNPTHSSSIHLDTSTTEEALKKLYTLFDGPVH
jgi:hypothetical protein